MLSLMRSSHQWKNIIGVRVMLKPVSLYPSAKSNLRDRVLGEAEKKSLLALTGRVGTLWALVSQKGVT